MATPMLTQYEQIKSRHRDAILFFRLGDFYEMFGEDAREGARLLGLTLTKRQNVPMCGVPHHAARTYIHRLLKQGRKVAVCEQTSAPDSRQLVEREVVEVLSPGTVFDLDYLDPKSSNFIAAFGVEGDHLALTWCDVSTGELCLAAYALTNPGGDRETIIRRELARLSPRELVVQESLLESSETLGGLSATGSTVVINRIPDWGYDRRQSFRRLTELFGVQSLRGFGIEEDDPALLPAAALLEYLEDNARHVLSHMAGVRRHRDTHTVILDDATIRNLELIRNMQDGGESYTLVEALDYCETAMGSRMLRRRILTPDRDIEAIEKRLNRVEELYRRQDVLQALRGHLASTYDLERLVGRLGVEKAHPKDLVAIANTLRATCDIAALIPDWYGDTTAPEARETGLVDTADQWRTLHSLRDEILETVDDEPSVSLADGGIIRNGFDSELDRLRSLQRRSRDILDEYLAEQRTQTGISSLKIRYNRVLGHFFEVPRSQADRLPDDFIRRQSLANAERFTTTRLAELETEINNAGEAALQREQELFLELRRRVAIHMPLLSVLAKRIASVDVVASFARGATLRGYRRPTLVEHPTLDIRGGRHPVVESHLAPGEFVENDVLLGEDAPRFALITGPNMAGKSTVLRQTALITLMAHIGSFVPAETARIGLCDRIFCRVGASDNIARGESTFLVEMNETSNILRNATPHSLVIMDEVGRGTSTHDGLAIAWAVSEHLLEAVAARTLFATHYHELSALEHAQFSALGMAVDHSGERIVFLKKLRAGAGDRSYGVDVARMAGLPDSVIARARAILARLEDGGDASEESRRESLRRSQSGDGDMKSSSAASSTEPAAAVGELFRPGDLVAGELSTIDPDTLSPREALDLIYRWKRTLD